MNLMQRYRSSRTEGIARITATIHAKEIRRIHISGDLRIQIMHKANGYASSMQFAFSM